MLNNNNCNRKMYKIYLMKGQKTLRIEKRKTEKSQNPSKIVLKGHGQTILKGY